MYNVLTNLPILYNKIDAFAIQNTTGLPLKKKINLKSLIVAIKQQLTQ